MRREREKEVQVDALRLDPSRDILAVSERGSWPETQNYEPMERSQKACYSSAPG